MPTTNTPSLADVEAALAECHRLGIPCEDAQKALDCYVTDAYILRLARDSVCCAVVRWACGHVQYVTSEAHVGIRRCIECADLPALVAALRQIGGAK